MIWCNKDKYNFISKLLKTNANKEVQYLKNLIEREELDKETKEFVNKFFLINNNLDQEFIQKQSFLDFYYDMHMNDFIENKKAVYKIVESILSQK
jgi:hypothetical protein